MLAAEIDVLFGTEMNEILRILREEALTALFAAAAWKDFKFRRIPNRLLAAGVLMRLLLGAAEAYLYGPGKTAEVFLREMGGSLLMLFLLMLAVRIHGCGLGMGDVKLAGTAVLYAGFYRTLRIMFWGFLAAAAAGACMKMASGKRRKTEIPLAPFFLTGFLLEWMLGKSFCVWP